MASSTQGASKTAELVAAGRAIHNRYDRPVILEDPYAVEFCGPFWKTVVLFPPLKWLMHDVVLRRIVPVIPTLLVRALYCERQAELAIRRGVTQYVIIGAGYDSFAMRRTDLTGSVTVFEVDQEGTQELKRRRMAKAGIAEPERVRYVAADLNETPLVDALTPHGFDPEKPAFFSWLGVSYYLPRKSVEALFHLVSRDMASGSAIVFDYLAEFEATPDHARETHLRCMKFVAKKGEPWIMAFDPNTLATDLREAGFSHIDHVPPWKLDDRFLTGNSRLSCPQIIGLCTASN